MQTPPISSRMALRMGKILEALTTPKQSREQQLSMKMAAFLSFFFIPQHFTLNIFAFSESPNEWSRCDYVTFVGPEGAQQINGTL